MAISLKKGQKVDLTKSNPGLSKILIGLGWDTNKYDGGNDFDLDSSVFLLGTIQKLPTAAILSSSTISNTLPVASNISAIISRAQATAMTKKLKST